MIRNALLLCAAILSAVLIACQPSLAPPTPGPRPLSLAGCTVGNPSSFGQVISYLDRSKNYSPEFFGTPPSTTPDSLFPPAALADLQKAFSIAPDFLQAQLCGLDGVY